jgi:Ca2+ transporting ATPase
MMTDQLKESMLQAMMLAAILSLIVGYFDEHNEKGWIEGASMIFACFLIATFTASMDFLK